jgi:hypothetical protein
MEFTSIGPRVEIQEAFTLGLRQKFGDAMGDVLSEVIQFYQGTELDNDTLQKIREDDSAAVLSGIVANTVTGATMRGIRGQMIAAAIMADKDGVLRWATQGLNRCDRAGGEWAGSRGQWEWVLQNPDRFIVYARHVKYLFNQI